MKYDPLRDPNTEEWLALDESERITLIEKYHRRKHIQMPSLQAHALIHQVVENQIAIGDTFPAKTALKRLMDDGLDRHEAVHAIGSLVAETLFAALKGTIPSGTDPNRDYTEKLERLTAASWIAQYGKK